MRIARKLMLLAMAGVAITAPSMAFAQNEPELHNQTPRLLAAQEVHAAADVVCPAVVPTPPPAAPALSPTVTSGGCRQHYTAPDFGWVSHLSAGGTEVLVSTCNIEFDIRSDAAGEGWITHQELTQAASGTCTRQTCGQPTPPTGEGRAWVAYLQETEVAGQGPRESLVIYTCTAPTSDPTFAGHCEFTIPVSQPSLHRQRWTATDVPGHGAFFPHCELIGTFDREAALGTTGEAQLEQNVEIRHT